MRLEAGRGGPPPDGVPSFLFGLNLCRGPRFELAIDELISRA
jgi:hypothetical protein